MNEEEGSGDQGRRGREKRLQSVVVNMTKVGGKRKRDIRGGRGRSCCRCRRSKTPLLSSSLEEDVVVSAAGGRCCCCHCCHRSSMGGSLLSCRNEVKGFLHYALCVDKSQLNTTPIDSGSNWFNQTRYNYLVQLGLELELA